MWGIRALKVCAALALLATAGCKTYKGGPSQPGDTIKEPVQYLEADDVKRVSGEQSERDEALKGWRRGGFFKDQPSNLTPERVHGGIY